MKINLLLQIASVLLAGCVIKKCDLPKDGGVSEPPVYVVKKGEDIYCVAIRWGVEVEALKRANNLNCIDVTPGQKLIIPPEPPRKTIATQEPHGPLGSQTNPIRCDMPEGEWAYFVCVRTPNGKAVSFNRQGSVCIGDNPYGNILDEYEIKADGQTSTVYVDMYHPGFVETNAPFGYKYEPGSRNQRTKGEPERLGNGCVMPSVRR